MKIMILNSDRSITSESGMVSESFHSIQHINGQIPNTGIPQKYIVKIIKITERIFRNIPARAISLIRNGLLPKTMAFGGVAIGRIKAIDAARVTGIINSNGGIPAVSEIPAII